MKVVVTWIIGGTISGYCAIGSPFIATTPSSTMMIDSTMATIGRLTKKRAMDYFALASRRLGLGRFGMNRRASALAPGAGRRRVGLVR